MEHRIKLTSQEKIIAWALISEFSLKLLRQNLSLKEFKKRRKKIREEHLKYDHLLLKKWSGYEK